MPAVVNRAGLSAAGRALVADLKGRIAVVTDAGRGVGKGIAEGLAEAGATIYLTGQETARQVDELGGRGIAVAIDLRDDEAVAELFRRIETEAGRLDLLVNNAHQIWESLAARLMVAQGSGLIVNLSSRRDVMAQELDAHGVTALSLAVEMDADALQSPRFIGRCIAALAMDPDIKEKAGGRYLVTDLAAEYRFTDPGEDLA